LGIDLKIEPGTRLVHKRTGKTVVVIHGDNAGGVTLAGGGFIPPSQVPLDFDIQPRSGLSSYTTAERILLFEMAAGLARYNVHMALIAAEKGDKPGTIALLKEALVHTEEAQVFSASVTPETVSAKLEHPTTMRELTRALSFVGQ
jgi:hypothetical protein